MYSNRALNSVKFKKDVAIRDDSHILLCLYEIFLQHRR